ncbi:tripartite motif-containing protein 16-like [Acanthochromis polyacanthus]|uniref:tripartite motif-containing protein 16-like n=1 Tax=Acanthochromis polyacanthus TaxID=80966 RepID=UPI0022343B14|nr:tripartite motif-containing protein 16-like [Acanthochromis polyacanthus]
MAQRGNQLNSEKLSCSICLDLLKDPVTISCGHSYCMNCIKTHWDGEDRKRIYSCPQCKKIFTSRPELVKSVMLAELVEEQKKTGLQAAAADLCYAGPEDVACDVCTGRKMKSVKSCLRCMISYCEQHLQPHYDSPPLKKHKLMEPSKNLQENICSRHDEVMKVFCHTDQQLVCYFCTMDEHKGHETVPAAAERTKKQKELEVSRLNIQQRIQDKEKDVELLQQEKKSLDVKQQIRSQQKAEESRVKELQKKLEQEIKDLKRKDAELKKLSDTPDHTQFLHNYPSVSTFSESSHSSRINIHPRRHFKDVTAAVKEVRDQIQDILRDSRTDISMAGTQPDVPLSDSQPEPTTRAGFLKYARQITLDPNTPHRYLLLSEGNRKATLMNQQQYPPLYPPNPERFAECQQVLSKQSLTGRCYWEVEWRGIRGVEVAVAYKNISREGRSDECQFGFNNKSWALRCYIDKYKFLHNRVKTLLSGPRSSRIGIYLDHSAGILSFYSVSKTMTLLHRVQTTFTEPLLVGFHLWNLHNSAEFIKLKSSNSSV